jgi:uncharacterized protein YjcR
MPAAIGSKNNNVKLNASKVKQIRKQYATGRFSHRKLGESFGVSPAQIRRVVNLENWK